MTAKILHFADVHLGMTKKGYNMLSREDKLWLARHVLRDHCGIFETWIEGNEEKGHKFVLWIPSGYPTMYRGSREECEKYREQFMSYFHWLQSKREEYELQQYRNIGVEID